MNNQNIFYGALIGLFAHICQINFILICIWFSLMMLDIAMGVVKSAKKGELSSSIMKNGLLKKIGETIVLFAILGVEIVIKESGLDYGIPAGNMFIGWFAIKEFISIIENAGDIGITVPDSIRKFLKINKDEIEKN